MYFDKIADLRYRRVFWCSLFVSVALTIYLLAEGIRYVNTSGTTLGSFWLSPTFMVIGVTIAILLYAAYVTWGTGFSNRFEAKVLIDRMIRVFESYAIGRKASEFSCSDEIVTSVAMRREGVYVISIMHGSMLHRELVVRHDRIDYGNGAVRHLLPASELDYVRSLVGFFDSQLLLASNVDEIDRNREQPVREISVADLLPSATSEV